ncbi:RNA polymerase sigma factor [Parapedobacter koreensis]|uniref:RNA polymerase sigma factor, sigma-70 family n=1 Tax=Parapedobacter koreensis TaxID=332977 RepID=A0A1H7RAN0_9SPHI|nr:sigma-70 family RNA polymerase sigma factor [Parapedobacter koreensis]SEL57360.1 RNA polymerase sigma factor, sigma-70 family [Parapedobacter koreensis]
MKRNTDLTKTDLFKQLGEHHKPALDAIYDRYKGKLERYILKVAASPDPRVNEIISEVLEVMWARREEIAKKVDPELWMFGITRNRIRKSIASQLKAADYNEPLADRHYELPGGTPADAKIEIAELEQYMMEVIDQLPPRQREVVLKRWLGGLDNREIAQRHGTTLQTVKNQLTSALKTIANKLVNRVNSLLM